MTDIEATPELLEHPPPGMINAYGSLLKLDPKDSLFLGSHDYELYETRLIMGITRTGNVVVDVGAMIGYYTLILARQVGPAGRVYAFEPDPDNFSLLSENVGMNRYSHVTVRQAIVGDSSGPAKLFRAPEEFRGDNRSYATGDRPSVDVDMVALDDVISEPVDIVKIDVQGFEGRVLAGMQRLIDRSSELIMFVEYSPLLLSEAQTDPTAFLAGLREQGFRVFEIDEKAEQVRGVDVPGLVDRFVLGDGAYSDDYTNLLCVKGHR